MNLKQRGIFYYFLIIYFVATLIFFIFISFNLYQKFTYQSVPQMISQNYFDKSFFKTVKSISNLNFSLLRFMGFNDDFKDINLNINFKNINYLNHISKHDKLTSDLSSIRRKSFVNGKLLSNNVEYSAKIRLKGDRGIHWKHQKNYSFKVMLDDDKHILSSNKFSLQSPITRNYEYEWIFHKLLEYENLINLKYEFVNFYLNGEYLGPYVFEQSFDKYLVEDNNRVNGPIFSFKDPLLNEKKYKWRDKELHYYNKNYWDKNNLDLISYGVEQLSLLQKGLKSGRDLFDLELFGKFFAICDVLETYHGTIPKSIRLYLNPITMLFEPVGYDGHHLDKSYPVLSYELHEFPTKEGFWLENDWYQTLMFDQNTQNLNSEFFESYFSTLNKIIKPGYLEGFFEIYDSDIKKISEFIDSSIAVSDIISMHPRTGISPFHNFNIENIYERRSYIREKINLKNPVNVKNLLINDDHLELHLKNNSKFPIKIDKISYNNRDYSNQKKDLKRNNQLVLDGTVKIMKFYPIDENIIIDSTNLEINKIFYTILGSEVKSQPLYFYDKNVQISKNLTIDNLNLQSEFIKIENNDIIFGPGDLQIEENYIVPTNYSLVIKAGTNIDFINNSRIISYGDIQLDGLESSRINITSSDSSGRGIKVMNANKTSNINYVNFSDLHIDQNDFSPAILMFYESNVNLSNCIFKNISSEDAINIIKGEFLISNSSFDTILNDAIDSDFSQGEMINLNFSNIGNDGVDFSYSLANIYELNFNNVNDKSISIGEASKIIANNVNISDANIAIAVKDSSDLKLLNSTIKNSEIGFAIFNKKLFFEGSIVDIWRHINDNVKNEYLLESNSTFIVDGIEYQSNANNLKSKFYQ